MNNYTCGICNEPYGYVIPNPINHGDMQICKAHYDFLESVKNSILIELIKAGK